MAEFLESTEKAIQADCDQIKLDLGKFKKAEAGDKEQIFKTMKNKLQVLKKLLSTYDINLNIASNRVAEQYRPNYEKRCREVKELEHTVNIAKDDAMQTAFIGQTTSIDKRQKPLEQMNKQEVMTYGDQMLNRADQRLDNVTKLLIDGKQLQDEVSKELVRMEEMLIKTHETAKDTQSMLKRSKQLINYFYRQLQTDKIIWCFLIVLVLIILAIIIMSFAGVKSSSFNKNVLPNQK